MPAYNEAQFGDTKQTIYPGNGGTTLIWTPGAGSAANTSTNTTTGEMIGFWKPVKIKQMIYTVKTAQTGGGDNASLVLYVDGTAKGTLAITTQAATSVNTSTVINATVAAGKTVRVLSVNVATASDDQPAIGYIALTYQELFDNIDR